MKGIKNCVNWLLDNPMGQIKSYSHRPVRYNNEYKFIEFKSNFTKEWLVFEMEYLTVFDDEEWEIIKDA